MIDEPLSLSVVLFLRVCVCVGECVCVSGRDVCLSFRMLVLVAAVVVVFVVIIVVVDVHEKGCYGPPSSAR